MFAQIYALASRDHYQTNPLLGDGNFFLCSEADQQEVSKTTSPSAATIYIHPSAERGISSGKKRNGMFSWLII
jgi:hypothetical protein